MITEGYLVRHYQGRRGGRGPALIDIAQDHLLYHLSEAGIFDLGIALKGGTALRKFWAGNAGRFSTDLDLAGVDETTVSLIIDAIDGVRVEQFTFRLEEIDRTRRMRLLIASPLGEPEVPARLDLGRRPLWLAPELASPKTLPIHTRYGFALPQVPISTIEEVIAEKLARYRRVSLARDLYDLAWLVSRPFDESLVRRLVVLKVWTDVVEDKLGERPFCPYDILRPRDKAEFQREAIGYLTTPVDITGWINSVRQRFAFLEGLDEEEKRFALCNPGERWSVQQAINALPAVDY